MRPRLRSGFASSVRVLTLTIVAFFTSPASAHPQDGPHADLRIRVGDDGVRFSVGLNLVFMDTIDPLPREVESAVTPVEADRIEARLARYFRDEVVVEIDGERVLPTVESFKINLDPDPGMVAIFPRFGMRALVRSATILDYPVEGLPETVSVTWPVFPRDALALELEGLTGPDGGAPYMFLEAQLQAEGVLEMIRFSREEPTHVWRSSALGGGSRFAEVPGFSAGGAAELPVVSVGLGLAALVGIAWLTAAISGGRPVLAPGALLVLASVGSLTTRGIARVELPGTGAAALDAAAAESVFVPLHENLYRAFDFTDESDIYDALERSVSGDLLETLYSQIYGSLIDAENDGLLGIVTGVEPVETEITGLEPRGESPSFVVRHRWRVAGTVYHWGHSHTRLNEYEADYTVALVDGGWRITENTVREQRRIDAPPVMPAEI
ncbi:MAG: hypothetical protein AAFR38_04975 [Planctomycetota bacterium]